MSISSDVNTIFAYSDSVHPFHKGVFYFMAQRKRQIYILLCKTKAHFIHTYAKYLKHCCTIIDFAIREEKASRAKSPSKKYKPSLFALSANIRAKINTEMLKKAKNPNFNVNAVKKFMAILLTEFSLPELYQKDESFANFREKYLIEAEERASEIINSFLKFFHTFELMNIEDYTKFEEWNKKIKNSKHPVFKNKQDYEDMLIAGEFMSYNQEIKKLPNFTCDKEFHDSLIIISKEYKQEIGKIFLIKKK